MKKFVYGEYANSLRNCFQQFGSVFKMNTIEDPYKFLNSQLKDDSTILDVGAGSELIVRKNLGDQFKGHYYSMDNDPSGKFDFESFEDIPEKLNFDIVFGNQVLEHLDIDDAIKLMDDISSRLATNGMVIFTVPNIQHPNRQISNITHITPWGHSGMYFLLESSGISPVSLVRYGKTSPNGIFEKLLAKSIARLYRMDWCDSILIAGIKK